MSVNKVNQRARVLRYLYDFGSITDFEAKIDLGIGHVASRICELRQNGYSIGSKFETSKNRYGETVRYKRYFLTTEEGEK